MTNIFGLVRLTKQQVKSRAPEVTEMIRTGEYS